MDINVTCITSLWEGGVCLGIKSNLEILCTRFYILRLLCYAHSHHCENVTVLWLANKCEVSEFFDIHNKHETYRTSAPREGAYAIPCDDVEAGRTEMGTVGRTNEPTSAVQFIARD